MMLTRRQRGVPSRRGLRLARNRLLKLSVLVCCLTFSTLVSGALQASRAEAAPSTWTITPSPNQATGDRVNGISCVSPTVCVAVGSSPAANPATGSAALIETWNGAAWTPVQNPSDEDGGILNGVSCTSSTDCVAVGYFYVSGVRETLVETWNGTSWSIISSPNPSNEFNSLSGVSCTSSTFCVAVGYQFVSSPDALLTLVETWNGTTWSVVPSPNDGPTSSSLNGVSCVSPTDCVAVGGYTDSDGNGVDLIEAWDGTSWTSASSPTPGTSSSLKGVSCVSSTICEAVGGYSIDGDGDQSLVESWDGTQWTVTASPNVGQADNLNGVSCTSASSCLAVGTYLNDSDATKSIAESWNGLAWSLSASRNPSSGDSYLIGVSCAPSTSCFSAGYVASSWYQTLIESWNGTQWSVATSPNPGVDDNVLNDVSCVSATDCTAVGYYVDTIDGSPETLAETWNGATWSVAASPDQGDADNVLSSVSCASSTTCMAVGYDYNAGVPSTLIEFWNGTAWSVSSSPDPWTGSFLSGVSCVSSTDCVAVGEYDNGTSVDQTLVETWNGTAWSIASSPNEGSYDNSLSAVSCTSSTNCVAVGGFDHTGSGEYQTLIETWDGTAWSLTTSPNQQSDTQSLLGVSCPSATDCVAVGRYAGTNGYQALSEIWDGTTWSISPSLNPDPSEDVLRGVSCSSTTDCVAVGEDDDTPFTQAQTLVEAWDGGTWSLLPSPNEEASVLRGVSCISAVNCVAAGNYVDGSTGVSADETLIETGIVATPPSLTSADATTFVEGSPGTFSVTTDNGTLPSSLSEAGDLPSGVTFTDNGDGSATFTGTPEAGSSGTYALTITASNGISPDATQDFTLTVLAALCAPGTYSATGSGPCTEAPPGTYVDTPGATSATNCPVGTYNPNSGQTGCTPAPLDTYVDTTGATAVTDCPSGAYTAATGSTSAADCITPAPTITTFSPAKGSVGTVVTVKGTNLSGASKVTFNGVKGSITSDTGTKIKVKVPVGATTGKITVVTPGGKAKSAVSFSVPTTVSFTQASSLYQGGPVELTLNQPSPTTVVVSFSTSNGPGAATQSAEWLGDAGAFRPSSGTVTFAPGRTSATISLTIKQPTITGCSVFYSNCLPSVAISLSNPRNASLGSTPVADLFAWS